MKNNWEKQFDKKFNYPKTLWARDANGKVWYHKQDVKNFIRDLLDEQKQEIKKIIKKEKWGKEWTVGMCGEEGEMHNKSIDDILEVLNKEK